MQHKKIPSLLRSEKIKKMVLSRAANASSYVDRNNEGYAKMLCKAGRLNEALDILSTIQYPVDSFTYACLLQECISRKAFSEGTAVHIHMKEMGCTPHRFLGNTLLNLYVKSGNMGEALKVFDEMSKRDVCSWTLMIAGYSKHGSAEDARALFCLMQANRLQPNEFTFTSLLSVCAKLAALEQGMEVHEGIIRSGFQSDVFVESALVDMYAKCGSIDDARNVFDKMYQRDVVSWNAMISGYAQNGRLEEALDLFRMMPKPDAVSWNAMISGYVQTGLIEEALKFFWQMSKPDIVSWNVMIAAYARNGHGKEALKLYKEMQLAGVKPDLKTFSSILPACAGLASLKQGMEIHEDIVRSGFQSDVFVDSALVDMYAKCGRIEKARDLFEKMSYRNLVSWNIMIAGYAQNGDVEEAMKLFHTMPERDTVSWNAMIVGYSQSGHIDEACNLFNEMPQPDIISWNAMISGYAQNGRFKEAFTLFQKMPNPDIVTWNVMIAGFVHNGHSEEALKLFWQMKLAGVKPDLKCFASVLPACANLAALEKGMEIHEEINRSEFQLDVFVENALIDMYAKCGQIDKARELFDKMCQRYVVSWNTMIGGYAVHGLGKEAIKLFEQMQQSGVNPDHVTFVCVLSACCHAGLVDEGCQYFDCMGRDYHIQPTMEHYVCMVDLLGRAGRLDEAEDFINKMAIKHASVWRCLLGVCKLRNNVELGERVAERLYDLDPENATPYVLLSSIYAAAGRWDDAKNVRRMMKDRMIKKTPGCSWIEVNKQVHAFLMGERSHPQAKEISAKLETLTTELKTTGYVLHDVEEEQEEEILCHHSNKWAIAFA